MRALEKNVSRNTQVLRVDADCIVVLPKQRKHVRIHERHEVNISVHFERAESFVAEYAENLSRGGLFVAGAHILEPLSHVNIELNLPGNGSWKVVGKVAHILSPAEAESAGRSPGAGFELVDTPNGFSKALEEYLWRLGRRRDAAVLVEPESAGTLLEAAGFEVRGLPPAKELVIAIARCEKPVVGVVVSSSRLGDYFEAANVAGGADLLIPFPSEACPRHLLPLLDSRLER